MSLLAWFTTVTLIAGASAFKYCCSPEKYSAETLIRTYTNGEVIERKGKNYFDYSVGMYVTVFNITLDEKEGSYVLEKTYLDIKSYALYTVVDNVCTKSHVESNLIPKTGKPNCIPDDSILVSSIDFGGPHEYVGLNRFVYKLPYGHVETVFTQKYCYPVAMSWIFNVDNINVNKTTTITEATINNLKLTMDDPFVFDLPASCKNPIPSMLPADPLKLSRFMTSL